MSAVNEVSVYAAVNLVLGAVAVVATEESACVDINKLSVLAWKLLY